MSVKRIDETQAQYESRMEGYRVNQGFSRNHMDLLDGGGDLVYRGNRMWAGITCGSLSIAASDRRCRVILVCFCVALAAAIALFSVYALMPAPCTLKLTIAGNDSLVLTYPDAAVPFAGNVSCDCLTGAKSLSEVPTCYIDKRPSYFCMGVGAGCTLYSSHLDFTSSHPSCTKASIYDRVTVAFLPIGHCGNLTTQYSEEANDSRTVFFTAFAALAGVAGFFAASLLVCICLHRN